MSHMKVKDKQFGEEEMQKINARGRQNQLEIGEQPSRNSRKIF